MRISRFVFLWKKLKPLTSYERIKNAEKSCTSLNFGFLS